jgi:hypothetical protein
VRDYGGSCGSDARPTRARGLALERNDVTAVHAVLFDILREIRSIRRLLEEDDDPEKDLADDDS